MDCACGALLTPVAVQVLLHRLAATDLRAQRDYQDRITAFHTRLRQYFYPLVFHERPFGQAEFAQIPRYDGQTVGEGDGNAAVVSALMLALLAGLALWWGGRRLGTVHALNSG